MDEGFGDDSLRLRPAGTGAALVLGALCLAILYNALFGQTQTLASPQVETHGAVTKMTVDAGEAQGTVVSVRVDPVVEAVQRELSLAGFYDGPVDGVAGRKTKLAIETWQRTNGLEATGVASQAMADRLAFNRAIAAAAGTTSSVEPQAVDSHIAKVQLALAELGYLPGSTDGQMSEQTRDAIRQFEQDRGLAPTGAISDALLSELAKTSGQSSMAGE